MPLSSAALLRAGTPPALAAGPSARMLSFKLQGGALRRDKGAQGHMALHVTGDLGISPLAFPFESHCQQFCHTLSLIPCEAGIGTAGLPAAYPDTICRGSVGCLC